MYIMFCSQWWNLELLWFQVIKIAAIVQCLLKLVIFNILNSIELFIIFCSQWWNLELPYDFKCRLISEGKFNSTSIFILIHSLLKLVIFNLLHFKFVSFVYYVLFSMMKLGIIVWFQVIKIAEIQFYFNLQYPNP